MVFTSVAFAFGFLPLVLLGHFLLRTVVRRNWWLLLASLGFYLAGSGPIVVLLVVTTLLDWFLGLHVGRAVERGDAQTARRLVGASVAANLGMLGWFKYANFFVDDVLGPMAEAAGTGGFDLAAVALPIGISFFVFQRLSYVIDVSRGEPPLRRPQDLLLYIALFPQLIAGPIVRYGWIREQLHQREGGVDRFAAGAVRFAHGFAKKVLIADAVAPLADAGFGLSPEAAGFVGVWIAVLAYTVQIYFDFSGYSDMAIGLGLLFGFDFPENFRRPYSALSITDFWRRWHLTLSSWFRDYLYVPLGGSRGGTAATLRNLLIVFLATGLWHGAAWTFVLWGLWHGAFLVIERLTNQRTVDPATATLSRVRRALTLLVVVFGWVLFRAETLGQATSMWRAMLTPSGFDLHRDLNAVKEPFVLAALIVGLATCLLPGTFVAGRRLVAGFLSTDPRAGALAVDVDQEPPLVTDNPARLDTVWQGATLVVFAWSLVLVVAGTFSPFLYFRF